jgi:tetratricopeptide (TPR) repeat protein
VSTRDMRVTQYVLVRTPAPMRLDTVMVLDGDITLIGKQGKILRLKPDTWDVIAWRDLATFMGEGETVRGMQRMAGTELVWLWTAGAGTDATLLVVDLARWSLHRSLSTPSFMPRRVGAHTRALMLLDGAGARRGIYRADGILEARYRLPETIVLLKLVTFHPRAPGFLVVDTAYHEDAPAMRVRWLSEAAEELAVMKIDSPLTVDVMSLGSDPDRGLIFLVRGRGLDERTLMALATDDGLRVHYRVPVSGRVAFLQDADGVHRFAMDCGAAELALVPIGSEPPRLPAAGASKWPNIMQSHNFECSAVTPSTEPHLIAFRAKVEEMGYDELVAALHALQSNPDMNADMWADVVATLARDIPNELADEVVAWARARHPDHADLALNGADYLANKPSWSELLALLDAIDTSKLSPRRLRHLHHLRGHALLETGRHEEALAAFTQGAAHAQGEEGACELQSYIEMLAPVDLDRDEGGFTTDAGRVHWSVLAAERCLARGDVPGALDATDRAHVWQADDVQALAHLASVYLQSEDRSPVHMFHQLLALAAFDACARPDQEFFLANQLVFPGATFSDEDLAALAERVRAWLEEHARRVSSGAADSPD